MDGVSTERGGGRGRKVLQDSISKYDSFDRNIWTQSSLLHLRIPLPVLSEEKVDSLFDIHTNTYNIHVEKADIITLGSNKERRV